MNVNSKPNFLLQMRIDKLNESSSDATGEDDEIYEKHEKEERKEINEFLASAVPAFFYSLSEQLEKEIKSWNAAICNPADRIQLHMNRRTLSDLLITSNVPVSQWFSNDISIEVAAIRSSHEIAIGYRRPVGMGSKSEYMLLYQRDQNSLGIVSKSRSYSIEDFAFYLLTDFLDQRESLRKPDVTDEDEVDDLENDDDDLEDEEESD